MAVLLRRFPGRSHIPDCGALFSRKPMWNHAFGRHFSAGEPEAPCHSGLTSSATVRQNASLNGGQLRGCHFMGDFVHGRIVMTNTLEDDVGRHQNEFKKWHNGGGMVHKSACIDPTALIEVSATVHSKSLVGAKVHIGSGTIIGPEVTIGQSTKIGYNVAVSNCTIGDSCVIHHGVSIGQDGFGFFIDEQGEMVKKPQELKAKIGNNVEIGANSCIDRGSWRDTVIGDNSKIDNLVQIGHNVVIGKSCMLCGQVGIAGSVTMGEYVTLGGRVGVRDHVSIVSKVRLAANSCVTKDIKEPGDYGGFPAVPIHKWRRQVAFSRRTTV